MWCDAHTQTPSCSFRGTRIETERDPEEELKTDPETEKKNNNSVASLLGTPTVAGTHAGSHNSPVLWCVTAPLCWTAPVSAPKETCKWVYIDESTAALSGCTEAQWCFQPDANISKLTRSQWLCQTCWCLEGLIFPRAHRSFSLTKQEWQLRLMGILLVLKEEE